MKRLIAFALVVLFAVSTAAPAKARRLLFVLSAGDRANPVRIEAADGLFRPIGEPRDPASRLIAREAGVIVTDQHGELLRAPLRVEPDIAWAGYANDAIRREIEPLLQDALKRRGL